MSQSSLDGEKTSWPKELLGDLLDGKLDPSTIKMIQVRPKDEDRFEKVLSILQERVPWKERIILPLQEHLYVVLKGRDRVVKCSCG